ncbi:hypothetical protein RN001_014368 [Aquatica leii]|uniref:Uncharacterized protein n=1 Tax=Aquatica leii TaxID=1421715 RepID=A0AAN7SBH8_9COLE|nr:hypothetical protein RN001_014368 [Aquatica leii]
MITNSLIDYQNHTLSNSIISMPIFQINQNTNLESKQILCPRSETLIEIKKYTISTNFSNNPQQGLIVSS